MRKSPALLMTLALYLKIEGKKNPQRLTDVEIGDALSHMQDVTEMGDDEIKTEEGLLTLAVQYALCKESFDRYQDELNRDYNSIYR